MASISSQLVITDQDARSTSGSATQGSAMLGQRAVTTDGKAFRYGVNGTGSGTAIAAGNLTQGAVVIANHQNRTGVTTVAGQSSVTFAVGATAVTSNQYAQGYLNVNAGTGAGQMLLISGNTSANSSGSPTVNLADEIITATLASDSKFSLMPNIYSAVIQHSATLAAAVTGVTQMSVPDTYYAWFQVAGMCSVLGDAGAAAAGAPITYSDDTAGAVGPYETDAVGYVLGFATQLGVSAEYRSVFLNIS